MNYKFEDISKKKKIIDEHRPLDKKVLKEIREKLFLDLTYNSNAIEGNTLTLTETKVVLEDGITIGGKTVREHLEAINHKEAINYLEYIIKTDEELSERQIKQLHYLILKSIDTENAGRYRNRNVLIQGAEHRPPSHILVAEQMKELINWYYDKGQDLHPIERACRLHSEFVKIHPFIDGNGRTARLLLNFELMKNGYPIVIIKNEDRLDYYNALEEYSLKGEIKSFVNLISKSLNASLDLYFEILELV
ncbi:Fic/DOC family protein [Orenia metallireducens]|jgi:Fic family protein|uniref:Fic/DOC family protein n=1 Tax=Orenia metallireducens TaxID=1413210 RepID=A0A285IHE0_9FIRM|nr:Fic family protein [Orenia metallireducens]SNY47372.1 Fic/DOC family protein [Orenia metallireducens]